MPFGAILSLKWSFLRHFFPFFGQFWVHGQKSTKKWPKYYKPTYLCANSHQLKHVWVQNINIYVILGNFCRFGHNTDLHGMGRNFCVQFILESSLIARWNDKRMLQNKIDITISFCFYVVL